MSISDKNVGNNRALASLLEKAELQGYLTPEDLSEYFPEGSKESAYKSRLITTLKSLGVDFSVDELGETTSEIDANPDREAGTRELDDIKSDDTISLYLKEMSITPLLSVEEEVELAKRIELAAQARREKAHLNGREIKRIKELELLIQNGDLAREALIKANTRLVVSIARRYIGRGVPFLDLIQEGNLGLMKAVEKFEYQRGFRFSTYATWWIRQSIIRATADQGRTIRVPVHMVDRIRNIYKAEREMEQSLGRTPTPQELADNLQLDGSKLNWMLQVSQTPISLESPIGDEDDTEFGMYIEDNASPSPAQVAYENMLREKVDEVLATLSPREARILRLRFGLGQDRPYTLEEVGQKFGLTRERIRQIEGKALRRLRQPCRARLLQEYR